MLMLIEQYERQKNNAGRGTNAATETGIVWQRLVNKRTRERRVVFYNFGDVVPI